MVISYRVLSKSNFFIRVTAFLQIPFTTIKSKQANSHGTHHHHTQTQSLQNENNNFSVLAGIWQPSQHTQSLRAKFFCLAKFIPGHRSCLWGIRILSPLIPQYLGLTTLKDISACVELFTVSWWRDKRDSSMLEDLPVTILRRVTGWGATHPTPFKSHPPQQMLPAWHDQYTIGHPLMSDELETEVGWTGTYRRCTGKTWAGSAKLRNC